MTKNPTNKTALSYERIHEILKTYTLMSKVFVSGRLIYGMYLIKSYTK